MTPNLMRFCRCEFARGREWLKQPWREGNWAYYSDGAVIVRRPMQPMDLGSILEHKPLVGGDAYRGGTAMFSKFFGDGPAFDVMPDFALLKPCKPCGNTGGTHLLGPCRKCWGRAFVADPETEVVCGGLWDAVYLRWLSELPQVRMRYATLNTFNTEQRIALPAEFVFDGGQALLMRRAEP